MTDAHQPILSVLSKCKRVLITTHVRPDGDAVGTAVAMALGLAAKGIESQVLLLSKLPAKYSFLFDDQKVRLVVADGNLPESFSKERFDAVLVVDTGTWSQ